MNELYFKYIKERENTDYIKNEKGFITYRIEDNVVRVFDLYVEPNFRRTSIATDLCDKLRILAKESGCNLAKAGICTRSNNSTEAMQFHLKYGMKIDYSVNDYIFLSKEI